MPDQIKLILWGKFTYPTHFNSQDIQIQINVILLHGKNSPHAPSPLIHSIYLMITFFLSKRLIITNIGHKIQHMRK